jgi:hypothetical protein
MWGFAHLGNFRSRNSSLTPQKVQSERGRLKIARVFEKHRRRSALVGADGPSSDMILAISHTVHLGHAKTSRGDFDALE